MATLLTIPREIRDKVYDFYLEGLELLIVPNEDERLGTRISFPSKALSLLRVNRQLNSELSPRAVPGIPLRLLGGSQLDLDNSLATIPRPFLDQIRYAEVPWFMQSRNNQQYGKTILALRNLKLVEYLPHPILQPEVFLGNAPLPPHDRDFKDYTAASIADFVYDPQTFARLKADLDWEAGRCRDLWEHDVPVSFSQKTSIRVCKMVGTEESLWVCIISWSGYQTGGC